MEIVGVYLVEILLELILVSTPSILHKFQMSRYWYHVIVRYSLYAIVRSESQ